ncbi:MAG: CoA transferase, partial [Candidatus Thorarchaeota archaeon]
MHDIMFAINIRAQAKEFIPRAKNIDIGAKYLPIYNQYHCKDGQIALTTLTEKQWIRLCENVLKKPELVKDPRFDNIIKRFDYVEILDKVIEDWSNSLTRDEAIKQLEAVRIPCGKTLRIDEVHNHPNLRERGMLCDQFDFSKWGVEKATIPNRLINFSNTIGSVEKSGPEFGVHNEEIYCRLLGFSEEDLKNWKRKKII